MRLFNLVWCIEMARIMALDYGKKRTGVAVTDPLKIVAASAQTIATSELMNYLTDYFAKNEVERVVVGMPRKMDGTPSENYQNIEKFLATFSKKFPQMPVVMHDERFTSVLAQRAMIEGGVKKMQRREKGLADTISASIILQSYLDSNL